MNKDTPPPSSRRCSCGRQAVKWIGSDAMCAICAHIQANRRRANASVDTLRRLRMKAKVSLARA